MPFDIEDRSTHAASRTDPLEREGCAEMDHTPLLHAGDIDEHLMGSDMETPLLHAGDADDEPPDPSSEDDPPGFCSAGCLRPDQSAHRSAQSCCNELLKFLCCGSTTTDNSTQRWAQRYDIFSAVLIILNVYMLNHGSLICSNLRPIYVDLSQLPHLRHLRQLRQLRPSPYTPPRQYRITPPPHALCDVVGIPAGAFLS
jgi:hypothetical protein